MATTVAQAFNEFMAKIELTTAQDSTVADRRKTAHGYLENSFGASSTMPLLRTHLIGSAQRSTIIRPLDDIDVLAVFENKESIFEDYRHDSFVFINRVRDALNQYKVQIVGTRGQAVRLFYKSMPHVDIAPVFKWSNGGYALPDGSGGWITTDPDFHYNYLNQRNKDLSYRLKPVTRILKRWNNTYQTRLKSFHLEMMVSDVFSSIGADFREAIQLFFENAANSLRVIDPAGHSGDLSSYLTTTNRTLLTNRFDRYSVKARDANAFETAGNHEAAINKWKEILGSDFPSYG